MLILAINTATNTTEVALIDFKSDSKDSRKSKGAPGRPIFDKSWLSNRDEAEKILPVIALALDKIEKLKKPLELIFVVAGPGSFTALRVGVNIANTLAFAKKVPLVSCTTQEYEQQKTANKKSAKFSEVVIGMLSLKKMPHHQLVKPVYLQPPKITVSKKQIFT